MKTTVILPAAGLGTRFGATGKSKIEWEVAGKPIFMHAVDLFVHRDEVTQVLLAVNPNDVAAFRFKWMDRLELLGVQVVPGGKQERWETIANALTHVSADATHIAVHDAARPMTPAAVIDRVFSAAQTHAAVLPGVAVSDTLKQLAAEDAERLTSTQAAAPAEVDPFADILGPPPTDDASEPSAAAAPIQATVPRRGLFGVQTPQLFEAALLRRAYAQITDGGLDPANITDDAGLIEALGEPVHLVEGSSLNLKLTRPDDAELITAYLEKQRTASQTESAAKRLFVDDDE